MPALPPSLMILAYGRAFSARVPRRQWPSEPAARASSSLAPPQQPRAAYGQACRAASRYHSPRRIHRAYGHVSLAQALLPQGSCADALHHALPALPRVLLDVSVLISGGVKELFAK